MKRLSVKTVAAVTAGLMALTLTAAPASAEKTPNQPAVVNTQTDQHGAKYEILADGSWRLSIPQGTGTGTNWVHICYGEFVPLFNVINGILEWGHSQTCENPASYPHWFNLELQSTCDGALCIIFTSEGSVVSPPWQNFTRVASSHVAWSCINTNRRKYRMIAKPNIRGVQYGPFFSAEITRPCSV